MGEEFDRLYVSAWERSPRLAGMPSFGVALLAAGLTPISFGE